MNSNKKLFDVISALGEGLHGNTHIINVGHEDWHEAYCVHHSCGYGVWVGREEVGEVGTDFVINEDYSEGYLYHFLVIDNFLEISALEFANLVVR